MRLAHLVDIRGESITVIQRVLSGRDGYGNPTYLETVSVVKALLQRGLKEVVLGAGEQVREVLVAYVKTTAPLFETDELEIDGLRYHIKAIERTEAYLKIMAERRVDQ